MTQLIITILNALLSAIEGGKGLASSIPGLVSDLLAVAGNIGGGLDLNRIEALGELALNAAKGNANSWQQLYNWSNYVGAEYPHGQEPSETLSLAKSLYALLKVIFPAWATTIMGPGGKNGDSPLDSPSPLLH